MDLPPHPAAAAPAPRHALRRVRTGDVDEQAELLSGWNQRYAQLSAGAFEGCIEEVWLDGVHLFVETTGRRLMQGGRLDAQRLAIGLPLALGQGPAVFCGARDWGADGGAAGERYCSFSGAGGFEFFTPEGLVMAGLEFDRRELAGLASPAEQALLEAVGARAGLHRAGAGGVAGLRDFMQGAFGMLRHQPDLIENPAVRGMLRQAALSNALEALLGVAVPAPEEPGRQRAWALVEQARALIQREPETPQTVALLCQALGVSRRTLQAAFQQVLGMAPAAFLRAVRLAGARRALREAGSVTEAAAQWGFWHFGHFAQDFRRMFGELPSQAWRRLHPPG